MKRAAIMAVAIFAISAGVPGIAQADSPDPAPADVCDGGWKVDIYAQSKKHLGQGPKYKDGPGGTIVLTRTEAGSASTKITAGGGVTVSGIVAEAKVGVSRESVKEVSWDTQHQFRRDITRNKYGNAQHGSWGHNVKWQKYYQLPNCRKTQITYGTADVANKTIGFRYWETSS
ncbi:hypothetical protein [Streptomyces sp. V1I6]|uniref:hypothetical protein n=1 Tax=Streptomyces sp. V1I6 TaxID=3042273 RepID=UPI002782319D|nr:hypothetical protein [Streptomyces sp. V1I6]MDQ0847900.1 hypothetical protein [Streptomyces sp. V1I6]